MKGTTTLTVTVTHYQHDQHFNVKRQSVLIYIFFHSIIPQPFKTSIVPSP
eukprot:jgi/Botrbrau1/5501/Bobra.27_1s0038.1